MAKKAKIDYDYENDVLYIYTGDKVKDSLQIEEFVVDFSTENKVVGVEVMNASQRLSSLSGLKLSKTVLSSVKDAAISIQQGKEILYVFILLTVVINKEKTYVRIPLVTPSPAIEITV